MVIRIHTCEHCGSEYSYQASGYGCHDKTNNQHFCPECMEALLKVPVKFEKELVIAPDTYKLTPDEVKYAIGFCEAEYEKYIEKCSTGGWPICEQYVVSDYGYMIDFEWRNRRYRAFYNDTCDYKVLMYAWVDAKTKEFARPERAAGDESLKYKEYAKCRRPFTADMVKASSLGTPRGELLYQLPTVVGTNTNKQVKNSAPWYTMHGRKSKKRR